MTNFGTMRYKHIISVVLWSMFLVACGPDRRVALAEKLMAEKETDSAIAVMQEIKEPQNNLTDRDYALYALLLSEAMHRKQQLNAETDTLLLPAIKYFSESGDSLYAVLQGAPGQAAVPHEGCHAVFSESFAFPAGKRQ